MSVQNDLMFDMIRDITIRCESDFSRMSLQDKKNYKKLMREIKDEFDERWDSAYPILQWWDELEL